MRNIEHMPNICLNMIVKNESEIIVEAFDNIRKYIDISLFIICDTGSSDDTISVMKNYFDSNQLKYEIYSDEWIDFEYNRNLALKRCADKSDYILFFDADDRFNGELRLPELTADIYDIKYRSAHDHGFYHFKRNLIKNTVGHWVGVLHESIVANNNNVSSVTIDGDYFVQTGHFGDRNKNPNKYLDDALVLENAFNKEKDSSSFKARYAHYCATSYFSHGDYIKAIEWFKIRIDLSNISNDKNEEYLAYRYLGDTYKIQGNHSSALHTWLIGWNAHPSKAELLYEASNLYAETNNYLLAYKVAMWGEHLCNTDINNSYCYEQNIYKYGLNYQISKYGLLYQYFNDAFKALLRIIKEPFYSAELVDHIIESFYFIIQNSNIQNYPADEVASLTNYTLSNKCSNEKLRDEILLKLKIQ